MKKILIVASGGDAPGINNYLHGLLDQDIEIHYGEYGLKGIYKKDIKILNKNISEELYHLPSSVIKCGRFPKFQNDLSVRKSLFEIVSQYDAFIIMGGNGSEEAAKVFFEKGINTIFIPLTVDNDNDGTDLSIGYATALENAIENINRTHYTNKAHGYSGLVEVMGRNCPDLTNNSYEYSLADAKVTSLDNLGPKEFAKKAKSIYEKQGYFTGIIMEKMKFSTEDYQNAILDIGIKKCNVTKLGHTQRGGKVNLVDLWLTKNMANKTKELINKKSSGSLICKNSKVQHTQF